MSPCVQIVQGVEDYCEGAEEVEIEGRVFDIGVMCFYLDVGIEAACCLFRDLCWSQSRLLAGNRGLTYQSFRTFDVFVTEEELSIQVAEVYGIEVDYVNFAEASEDKVLE